LYYKRSINKGRKRAHHLKAERRDWRSSWPFLNQILLTHIGLAVFRGNERTCQ
jgi:hypothetical protein